MRSIVINNDGIVFRLVMTEGLLVALLASLSCRAWRRKCGVVGLSVRQFVSVGQSTTSRVESSKTCVSVLCEQSC